MSEAGRIVPSQRQTARWEYYLQNLRSRRYSKFDFITQVQRMAQLIAF